MEDFELCILPVEINKEISITSKEVVVKENHEIEEQRGVLENTYGINYCIKMLEVIQNECEKHRLSPSHLFLTMDHSFKKMISHFKKRTIQYVKPLYIHLL